MYTFLHFGNDLASVEYACRATSENSSATRGKKKKKKNQNSDTPCSEMKTTCTLYNELPKFSLEDGAIKFVVL